MSQPIQSCFERYEKKYFLTPAGQKALLQAIAPYIKMDFYGKYTICNLYYDTPDWRLIRASLEKPVYKEKLRVRSYGVPAPDGMVLAELKKKYAGVVYKRRITVPAAEVQPLLAGQQSLADYGQIGREIAWFQQLYDARPRVFIGYDRIAFAGVADPELRITFDTGIRWRTAQLELCAGDHGAPLLPDDRVLLELKLPGVCPLWLAHALAEAGAVPVSFSKYGSCYCHHLLREQSVTLKEVFPCA